MSNPANPGKHSPSRKARKRCGKITAAGLVCMLLAFMAMTAVSFVGNTTTALAATNTQVPYPTTLSWTLTSTTCKAGATVANLSATGAKSGDNYGLVDKTGTQASSLVTASGTSFTGSVTMTAAPAMVDLEMIGDRAFIQDSNYIKVPNACPVVTKPTVNLSENKSEITVGDSATLSWTSTNADSLTASGDWSGSKASPSGTEVVTPTAAGSYTYTLTTNDNGAGNASDSVTLKVDAKQGPPPVTKTVHVSAKSLDKGCDGDQCTVGAKFEITKIGKDAPASITVMLSDGSTTTAALQGVDGNGTATYALTFKAGLKVTDATAVVPEAWCGTFKLTCYVCKEKPPVVNPTIELKLGDCVMVGDTTAASYVWVTNNADATKSYQVQLTKDGKPFGQPIAVNDVAAHSTSKVEIDGLQPGTYTATAVGDDGATATSKPATLAACQIVPGQKSIYASGHVVGGKCPTFVDQVSASTDASVSHLVYYLDGKLVSPFIHVRPGHYGRIYAVVNNGVSDTVFQNGESKILVVNDKNSNNPASCQHTSNGGGTPSGSTPGQLGPIPRTGFTGSVVTIVSYPYGWMRTPGIAGVTITVLVAAGFGLASRRKTDDEAAVLA